MLMGGNFKMMETSLRKDAEFHDDMIDNGHVRIKDFTFKNVFGDFRMFNGTKLSDMDFFLVQLAEITKRIKSQDIKDFKGKAIEKIKSFEGLKIEWKGDWRDYSIEGKFTAALGMNVSLAIATIENLIELFDLKEEDFNG